ncbi:MAG: sulfate ABC transporter ATP-binding protein [Oscillatoriales cyanobacterium SM2_2_1]|nr:sulfate ABC transporter ATP-binding protein [Oscillatoriales cyanobacterium SM2_2_1]
MGIAVEHVTKKFGEFLAIDDVCLQVPTGSLVALLGPSGSGKSTLLRMIAGLESPDQGRIVLTGEDATQKDVRDRDIGFVFQHYALFKHMTVRKNIAFGLEIRKQPRPKIRARVEELLELVQLKGLGDRYPHQLSGGQRQRVALARALAVEPSILLLDEPFGALDAKVRQELRSWLRHLHDDVHVTTVFVTHDQEEAMEVSDYVVVMHRGRVEQVGTPAEIYDRPQTSFVMSFIGPVNILPAHAPLSSPRAIGDRQDQQRVFVRPRDINISVIPTPDTVPAKIHRLTHLGWEVKLDLLLEDGHTLQAHLSREQFDPLGLTPSQTVHINPKTIKSFPLDYAI